MLVRLCLVLTAFAAACVDDTTATDTLATMGQPHHLPPREAFAACDGASAGATCAFDVDGHHLTGACRPGPDGDGPLACQPDHPPPPPEALAACASAAAGDACAFDVDSHHVTGTCHAGPAADDPLGCAPSQPPPGGPPP